MQLVTLALDTRSVARARMIVSDMLHGRAEVDSFDGAALGDAVLMVSELVTNAVRHATGLLQLQITLEDGFLRVGVVDDGPGMPTLVEAETGVPSGRGLKIVDTLADRWWLTQEKGSKTVWFEIALRSATVPVPRTVHHPR